MKNLTIEKITLALGKTLNVTNWKDKRLYIKGYGFNTKKCKQTIYLDLDSLKIVCYTDCDSQPSAWCNSQSQQVIDSLNKYARLASLINFSDNKGELVKTIEDIETEMTNEALDSCLVVGYSTEWRSEKIKINRYGKLAIKNRQFIKFHETTKNAANRNFVELSKEQYNAITGYLISNERMLEPFVEPKDFVSDILETIEVSKQFAKNLSVQIENDKIEKQKNEIEKQKKHLELVEKLDKVEGSEVLKLWKDSGCIQPAPAMVTEFKIISGLSWKEFAKTIK